MGGGVRARPWRPRAQPAVQGDSGPTSEIRMASRCLPLMMHAWGPSPWPDMPVVCRRRHRRRPQRTPVCATGSPLIKATPVGVVVVVLTSRRPSVRTCSPSCLPSPGCSSRAAADRSPLPLLRPRPARLPPAVRPLPAHPPLPARRPAAPPRPARQRAATGWTRWLDCLDTTRYTRPPWHLRIQYQECYNLPLSRARLLVVSQLYCRTLHPSLDPEAL